MRHLPPPGDRAGAGLPTCQCGSQPRCLSDAELVAWNMVQPGSELVSLCHQNHAETGVEPKPSSRGARVSRGLGEEEWEGGPALRGAGCCQAEAAMGLSGAERWW